MCLSNLVVILPIEHLDYATSTHRSQYKVQSGQPMYTRDQLLEIKIKIKLDNWYSILSYDTIDKVRHLKINKRP